MLVGRPEGKRPLGRPRRRWEDNIKMDLREVGYDGRDWINLAQDRDQWRAYVRAAMNLRASLRSSDSKRKKQVMYTTLPTASLLRNEGDNGETENRDLYELMSSGESEFKSNADGMGNVQKGGGTTVNRSGNKCHRSFSTLTSQWTGQCTQGYIPETQSASVLPLKQSVGNKTDNCDWQIAYVTCWVLPFSATLATSAH
ncbi:hypothetical protein ANN_20665 [Periplaneta americana]|uniref:Uncharacterized protein n=1 Tax=Periplaneta americana TaxID=6978 RepID=A0ABQ8SEC7_PERAM|nr:hypothetical protein ANN_20665 [Periplaneta americana]